MVFIIHSSAAEQCRIEQDPEGAEWLAPPFGTKAEQDHVSFMKEAGFLAKKP